MEFKVDGLYRTLRYKQTFNHLKIISNHLNKSRLYKNNRYSKRWFRNIFEKMTEYLKSENCPKVTYRLENFSMLNVMIFPNPENTENMIDREQP